MGVNWREYGILSTASVFCSSTELPWSSRCRCGQQSSWTFEHRRAPKKIRSRSSHGQTQRPTTLPGTHFIQCTTPISFYKNTFHKKSPPKKRTSIRTCQPQFWAEKCFFLFGSKFVIVNTKSYYILSNSTSYCNLG